MAKRSKFMTIPEDGTGTYSMDIEFPANVVKQHGFHLGTIHSVAESFVLERLTHAVSIALRHNGDLIKIYDFRDLQS